MNDKDNEPVDSSIESTKPSAELLRQLQQGIDDAKNGRTVDLGSFAQYVDDEIDDQADTLPAPPISNYEPEPDYPIEWYSNE